MAICPFMSKSSHPDEQTGCIISCALYIQGKCAFNILAQKTLFDAKREANLAAQKNIANTANSSSNT